MKKKIAIKISLAIVLISLLLSGITFSYLTDGADEKVNAFFPGVLTAPIEENGNVTAGNTVILTPSGTNVIKQVQILNTQNPHEVDCYIRVMLVPVFRTNEGTLAANVTLNPSGNNISVTAPNGESVTFVLANGWEHDWIYDNGYFYYKNIVHPGQETTMLLNNVTVSDEGLWDSLCIEVLSDSIQAEGNAAANAWGSIADQLE
ncbi:MAG: hypothetical protein GYA50_10785 [Eubacteriaceae bacterium]|nr:hypothetical protein [Eubacteriaceae bacterium]